MFRDMYIQLEDDQPGTIKYTNMKTHFFRQTYNLVCTTTAILFIAITAQKLFIRKPALEGKKINKYAYKAEQTPTPANGPGHSEEAIAIQSEITLLTKQLNVKYPGTIESFNAKNIGITGNKDADQMIEKINKLNARMHVINLADNLDMDVASRDTNLTLLQ